MPRAGNPRAAAPFCCREPAAEKQAMPAKSKKQQKAAGAALAAKRGDMPKSRLRGASREMAQSMSETELRDLAKTKRKNLPTRSDKS